MATQAQDLDQYIAELQQALQKNPDCANTNYNLGVAFLSKRMFKEGEECFHKAIDEAPKLVEAYVQLGGIAMERGDLDSCLHYNIMAVKHRPFFAVPWANIGFVHMQRGETDEALKAFKKAVKQDPNFVQAYSNLGGVHFMRGELEESLKWNNKAIEIEPMFGPAYNNMAMCYIEMERWDDAEAAVKKAQETGYAVPEEIIQDIKNKRK